MTDLKTLLEAEANATSPPPIDTTATINRIAHHRRRRTAVIAGAAAVLVATTATFTFGNQPNNEIPVAGPTPTGTRDVGTAPTPGVGQPLGSCGDPAKLRDQPASALRMTLQSARIEDKSGPWRIIVEVKVTNHSAQTLSGVTARGPQTMAAAMGNVFAFGGQRDSAHQFKLTPGASATYTGVITLGDCINAIDSSLGQTYQVYAQQTFIINGKAHIVSGGPWDVR